MSQYGKPRRHEPIPANEIPDPIQWVWIIDRCMLAEKGMRGDRFALLKKNKGGGVTVIVRGYARSIPKAESRHFFFNKEEAKKYVRSVLTTERNSVIERERKLAKLLAIKTVEELLNAVAPPTSHILPPPFEGKLQL